MTGTLQQSFQHKSPILQLEFSPDGKSLACGYDDTVVLRDIATGVLYHTLKGNSYPIKRAIFSSDGKLLACRYSGHEEILIWNIITGAKEQTWTVDDIKDRDMDKGVDGLDFFQNGSFLTDDIGNFNPQSRSASCDSSLSEETRGISLLEGEWIALNGEKVMWLPRKIRPTCSATHGRVLALGHASGRVTFIGA